ncbi:MAG: phage terminase large subunit, partial [Gallicola sp.]|nr:phage terminase large subunit [Gallicola sp.]
MILQTAPTFREITNAFKAGYTTVSAQGGARSGKTYNILIWLIAYAIQHEVKVTIARATLPAIKRTVLEDFKKILIDIKVFDEKKLNKTELNYTLPNGSFFEFISTDSEQKLRGGKRDILFCNEANELRLIEWQQLKMRTTTLAILDYNPSFGSEHWI